MLPGLSGHHVRNVAFLNSARQIVVIFIILAVFAVLVVLPVLGGLLVDLIGMGAAKVGAKMFVVGLAALGIGLAASVQFLIVAGASMAGAVLLGAIFDNY